VYGKLAGAVYGWAFGRCLLVEVLAFFTNMLEGFIAGGKNAQTFAVEGL